MDIKQLSYFLHVAELGSFTRAANVLEIAQPALSRQVRQLEVELKQTLLIRNGRGASLTEAGKRLLQHARGILYQLERAQEDLDEMRGAPVGHAAVGVPPSLGRDFTVALVEAFRARHPNATLGVVEGMSSHVLEWLALGRIDLAVAYNPAPSPLIDIAPLFSEPLYLVGPAGAPAAGPLVGEPIPFLDVLQYDLIMPSRPHVLRMFVENQVARAGRRLPVALEVDGIAGILSLVARGHGHTVMSLNAVRSDPLWPALMSRPIVEPGFVTTLALATSSQRPLTPLARSVADMVRSLAPR